MWELAMYYLLYGRREKYSYILMIIDTNVYLAKKKKPGQL
jgi:hypothetical protein